MDVVVVFVSYISVRGSPGKYMVRVDVPSFYFFVGSFYCICFICVHHRTPYSFLNLPFLFVLLKFVCPLFLFSRLLFLPPLSLLFSIGARCWLWLLMCLCVLCGAGKYLFYLSLLTIGGL